MSNDTKTQNLNEQIFTPDYGSDNHGIAYSCGHINPLQRALLNNGLQKIEKIRSHIQKTLIEMNNFNEEIMEFAKNRCEDIRLINAELRDAVDEGCNCECEYCDTLQNDKEDLQIEIDELEYQVKNLENDKEDKERKTY